MATQKEDQKLFFKTDYGLMQVKILQNEHSAILSTFIKLPFVSKIFVLSIFEWRLKASFTVWLTFGEVGQMHQFIRFWYL